MLAWLWEGRAAARQLCDSQAAVGEADSGGDKVGPLLKGSGLEGGAAAPRVDRYPGWLKQAVQAAWWVATLRATCRDRDAARAPGQFTADNGREGMAVVDGGRPSPNNAATRGALPLFFF